ncbi:MAG: hypothetical protein QOG87_3049 [Actinomycetota bacterium]|jgi:hypothetical protein
MAPVSTLERVTFECARCEGTIDRATHPRTCPHCQAKKADRCQLCDRPTYIGAGRCPEHADPASGRPTAMLPPAPAPVHGPARPAPRWASALARAAIAVSLLGSAGLVVRNQTRVRDAGSFQDLGAMLVDDTPAPHIRVEDHVANTGPVDFERAVHEDVEGAAARKALTDAGLVRGYTRQWKVGGSETEAVNIELFQYRTHAGAVGDEARLERLVPQVAATHHLSWSTFPVRSVPGGHGYSLVAPDGSVSIEVVAFARGQYAAAVTVTSADQAEARAVATAMAEEQRARLSRAEPVERVVTDTLKHIRG